MGKKRMKTSLKKKPLHDSTKTVTLISHDGKEFTVSVGAAIAAKLLQTHVYMGASIDYDDDDDNAPTVDPLEWCKPKGIKEREAKQKEKEAAAAKAAASKKAADKKKNQSNDDDDDDDDVKDDDDDKEEDSDDEKEDQKPKASDKMEEDEEEVVEEEVIEEVDEIKYEEPEKYEPLSLPSNVPTGSLPMVIEFLNHYQVEPLTPIELPFVSV
jgi:hypothetical protein